MANLTVNISSHPPAFDRGDLEGTVKKLCDYNVKLLEELQFLLTQMEKLRREG